MKEIENTDILLIDEELASAISLDEAQALKPIQKFFIESYLTHKDITPVDEWLHVAMAEALSEYDNEEVLKMSNEIITTLKIQEKKKASLDKAIANGRSKESWFAGETKKAVSYMSAQEASKYLQELDNAVSNANESLYRTIHTQAGIVNQNPHLDGFIAEQYHAQTFNLNAETVGSSYRAKVLEPKGTGYAKNSVDIVVVDGNGKIVSRYQSKYCKNAEATAKAFEHGDYRGQQKLVPEGQEQSIAKKVTTVIEAPDGTTSKAISKKKAKELQNEAQSGKWKDIDWNDYKTSDIAIGIGKQAGEAALLGAAVGVGLDTAQKIWRGEKIEGKELVEVAIITGSDFGVKAAVAGALKVGVEKGIITMIPKGTPAGTIADIAYVAIENVKVLGKIANGELTLKEGIEKIEQTTVSTVTGIAAGIKGTAIGAKIGMVLGPIGAVIGGFIGGTVGYMAGSKFGETVVKCAQKVRTKIEEVTKYVKKKASDAVDWIRDKICDFLD